MSPGRRRPAPEIAWRGEWLSYELTADGLALALDDAAAGLSGKDQGADRADDRGVNNSCQQREQREHDEGGTKGLTHGSLSDKAKRGQQEVDELDPDERDDQPSDAVDQEVATQERRGGHRAGRHT